MGTYKVIQDIEAEDKLLGPLTLKQFIFAGIALTCGYLSFMAIVKGAALLLIFLVPPMLFTGFMAWPWSRDQPTEIWLIAKLRFFFKPRRRIWDQNGLKQLVTVTAPKLEERIYTDGLSQTEVKSRLQALANTIDSRGWAVKNINVNLFAQPQYALAQNSDRLIDPGSLPQEVSNADVMASDDILDERNNPTAQHLDQMIAASSQAHRQQVIAQMQQPAASTSQSADYWFLNQPSANQVPAGYATFDGSSTVTPGQTASRATATTADEQALLEKLHHQAEKPKAAYGHMKTIDPHGHAGQKPAGGMATKKADKAQKATPKLSDPAILNLAHNDDLNVATIARQANEAKRKDPPQDEVVISLR